MRTTVLTPLVGVLLCWTPSTNAVRKYSFLKIFLCFHFILLLFDVSCFLPKCLPFLSCWCSPRPHSQHLKQRIRVTSCIMLVRRGPQHSRVVTIQTTRINIRKHCIFPTKRCIQVFRLILTINK
jgi:hypothetical protein